MSRETAPPAFNDPDLDRLVRACGSAFGEARTPFAEGGDWLRFLHFARYHRVEAIAWKGLRRMKAAVPGEIAAILDGRARDIAAANLRLIGESARLRDVFTKAGIAMLFLKGATLAKLAYNDVALKSAADIDLLVHPADLPGTARLLDSLGYRLASPRSSARLVEWHRLRKESLWVHGTSGVAVDLHSRLADSPALVTGIWNEGSVREVSVANGISLPTLRPDELAAYLAVHGATCAWFRLKWLVDFAALVEREHRGKTAELRSAMVRLGGQRAGDQALHLADSIFGVIGSDAQTRAAVGKRWAVRTSSAIAKGYLRRSEEPTERFGRTLGIHTSGLLILSRTSDRLSQLAAKTRMFLSGSG